VSSSNSDSFDERRLGRTISLDQAAELMKVSRRTIYNWIRNGRLRTIRTALGSQRVLVESLFPLRFRRYYTFSNARPGVPFGVPWTLTKEV
jgi:excisionase family DNA binding protein